MGKKRHNAKARQVVKINIDDTETKGISLEFGNKDYGGSIGTSNLLVLPSKKRQTKIISEKREKTRFLSKAHRKRLEKIVDKKQKKENRTALLEALSQVQVSPDEMRQMTSISAFQTIGSRKIADLNTELVSQTELQPDQKKRKFSSIAGAKKRLMLLNLPNNERKKKSKYDPNIVGLDDSSTNESSELDDEDGEDTKDNEVVQETFSEKDEDEKKSDRELTNEVEDIVEVKNKKQNSTKLGKSPKVTDTNSTEIIKVEDNKPKLSHPTKHINVKRDPKVQVARLKLPILGEEQKIMELINENEIVIIAGETGSGKTTQIPQFLYEAGYAEDKMIAVTEPRRVATIAMATRVGYELGLTKDEVSYIMRFEGNVTKDTRVKFMTDGVLLKEVQSDLLLSKYSVVIIDEAHERSIHTDVLLGLLSRVVGVRRRRGAPLRLLVMSATLRVQDFTENPRLFKTPPPVVNIESRQFPVTIHFDKTTPNDYLKEAYKKAVKIHTRLPDGGILIFVTGQREVHYLVRKLKNSFPYKKDVDYSNIIKKNKAVNENDGSLDSEPDDLDSDDDEVEKEMKRALKARKKARKKVKALPKVNLDDYDTLDGDGQADLFGNDEDDSEGHLDSDSDVEPNLTPEIRNCRQPLWVLPLYSMLGSDKQAQVFEKPPVGARLCVVTTDVAETSLTIPSIRYVVDTGKKKMRVYEHTTGASAWRVAWTSQASAGQRAGRAGRTAPGHAYRLYSSAVFQHDLPAHHLPDLCTKPVDDLILHMKCMGIDKVVNFPFPTAPDRMHLKLGEMRLQTLGLLEKVELKNQKHKNKEEILKVTPLGRAAAAFPLLPRYGKMLALSHQHNLLPYSIALVSALSVPELLTGNSECWPAAGQMLLLGDAGVMLRAVGAADLEHYCRGDAALFCAKYGLREKAIKEIRKLRKQLTSEINHSIADVDIKLDPEMKPPDDNQAKLLRQIMLCGLGDQVGRKIAMDEVKQGEDRRKYKYAYHCGELDEPVHLHSSSILRKVIPEWIVYQEMVESGEGEHRKMVVRHATAVEPEWLPVYVPNLCRLEPVTDIDPRYDAGSGRVKSYFRGTFGKAGWELPRVELDYPEKMERYRWFGRFLLEGVVFSQLQKYRSSLLSPPSTMVKSWANLQPRTEALLKALLLKRAGDRDSLKAVWQDQPKYLLNEYLKWIPVSAHNEATVSWPPL